MRQITIDVTSDRGVYLVVIGAGAASELGALLAARAIGRQRLLVSSPRVWRLHGRRIAAALDGRQKPALIPDGERAKTLATVGRLYKACVSRGLDRSAAVIAVGGGVIGDVAGFAAA